MIFTKNLKKKRKQEKENNVTPPEIDDDAVQQDSQEETPVPLCAIDLWKNPQAVRLISWLLGQDNTRIDPEINLQSKEGYAYPAADDVMDTSGKTTVSVLEALAEKEILSREDFERILLSPDGFIQLIPVERCPNCDSPQISRGKMIEHFACGHVGFEEEFTSGLKSVCPKCKKELKLIGTDYRTPGLRYTCHNCHGVFPLPTIKYRCLKTGEIYTLEELNHIWLYSYQRRNL